MQENGEIEIVSNLHYFGNKRCRLLPGIHLRYLWLMRNESFEEFEKEQSLPGYIELQARTLCNAMLQWAATKELDNDIITHWPVDELTLLYFVKWHILPNGEIYTVNFLSVFYIVLSMDMPIVGITGWKK